MNLNKMKISIMTKVKMAFSFEALIKKNTT